MNQLTEEQRKRLAEVRENRRIWHGNMGQVTRDIDFLLSLLDSQAAGGVLPTTPLLQKIVEVADLGSAQEFGDSLERLRAIRGMIIGESV